MARSDQQVRVGAHDDESVEDEVQELEVIKDVGVVSFGLVVPQLVMASIFVQNFWCRYLCPYGGFLGLVSLLSPTRITRNSSTCIDCAMCAKACPSALPVDKLLQIRSAECTGCLECMAICPAKGALAMSVLAGDQKQHAIPAWSMAAGIAILFLGMVGYAKVTGQWNTNLPKQVYLQLVPNASEQNHPTPGHSDGTIAVSLLSSFPLKRNRRHERLELMTSNVSSSRGH